MPRKKKVVIDDDEDINEEEQFDPYKILGLTSSCTDDQIKKAYRVLALKHHPDRSANHGNKESTKLFQELSRAYAILGDPNCRKTYDKTGCVDGLTGEGAEWFDYWRVLYPKISVRDIKDFEEKYKNSEEEWDDLKEAYLTFEGDMDLIMSHVILAEAVDEDRFRTKIEAAIKSGDLDNFNAFSHESAAKRTRRSKNALREAKEAEVAAVELGIAGKSDDQLRDMIRNRSKNNFENMMASLEAKYGNQKPKSRRKK